MISYLSYRTLLLAVVAVIGACALTVLARRAPEPGSWIVPTRPREVTIHDDGESGSWRIGEGGGGVGVG